MVRRSVAPASNDLHPAKEGVDVILLWLGLSLAAAVRAWALAATAACHADHGSNFTRLLICPGATRFARCEPLARKAFATLLDPRRLLTRRGRGGQWLSSRKVDGRSESSYLDTRWSSRRKWWRRPRARILRWGCAGWRRCGRFWRRSRSCRCGARASSAGAGSRSPSCLVSPSRQCTRSTPRASSGREGGCGEAAPARPSPAAGEDDQAGRAVSARGHGGSAATRPQLRRDRTRTERARPRPCRRRYATAGRPR